MNCVRAYMCRVYGFTVGVFEQSIDVIMSHSVEEYIRIKLALLLLL